MFTHKVIRPFPSQEVLFPGKLVDATGWLNRELLERQGYIEPVEQPAVETPAVVETPATPVVETPSAAPEGRRPRRRQA